MRVIVGVGNPGRNYLNTRHNIGFHILDKFAQELNLEFKPTKSDFWKMESIIDAFPFFLVKPTTYVNNIGVVLNEIVNHHGLSLNDLLVVYDDVNLENGIIRIRKSGSDGGHNGIKSIIYNLETDIFPRIRIGVGKQLIDQSLADYVLEKFTETDVDIINNKTPLLIGLIKNFIIGGYKDMLDYFSKETNINTSNLS